MKRDPICFFHSKDLDGHCCAAIVKEAFPGVELYGIDYGDKFPWDKVVNRRVIMVDFSLQPKEMIGLQLAAISVVWIDHHKSSIISAAKHGIGPGIDGCEGKLESGKAGCELTWEYFFPGKPIPYFVRLLGRYDVWDHENPDVLLFHWGMLRNPTNLQLDPDAVTTWDGLWMDHRSCAGADKHRGGELVRKIIHDGTVIQDFMRQYYRNYAQTSAFETELLGVPVIAVCLLEGGSLALRDAYDPKRHKAMVLFGWSKGEWDFSLRSDQMDVSQLAGQFVGGGGHKEAAGFQTSVLPDGFLK